MIFNEDKTVKLGTVVLPGLLKSMEIKASAKIEEQNVQGKVSKPKQAIGYEDSKITIELIIDDMANKTKEKQLESIKALFKAKGQQKPNVYPIVNEYTALYGINKVIIKDFRVVANNKTNQIFVTLELLEDVPMIISATKIKSKEKKKKKKKVELDGDFKNYLANRGSSPFDVKEDPAVKRYQEKIRKLEY